MSQLLLNTPDKRRGFFKVSVGRGGGLTQEEAAAIFDGFIPMHIESDLYGGEATYYGISPHFDEVEFGFVVPEYRPILVRHNDCGKLARVHWLREGEREPVQYLQEPDWDAVRNAVEKVIRRHDIELKVEARKAAEKKEKEVEQDRVRRMAGLQGFMGNQTLMDLFGRSQAGITDDGYGMLVNRMHQQAAGFLGVPFGML